MSFCLDTNVLVSIFFADVHSTRAFAWLERVPEPICVSDWLRLNSSRLLTVAFELGCSTRTPRMRPSLISTPSPGIARNVCRTPPPLGRLRRSSRATPGLKLSAADALHLALSAEGGHCLVTFDFRLIEAARARGYSSEIP